MTCSIYCFPNRSNKTRVSYKAVNFNSKNFKICNKSYCNKIQKLNKMIKPEALISFNVGFIVPTLLPIVLALSYCYRKHPTSVLQTIFFFFLKTRILYLMCFHKKHTYVRQYGKYLSCTYKSRYTCTRWLYTTVQTIFE